MSLSLTDIKTYCEIARNIVEIIALAVGGIWAYGKFIKMREPCPKGEVKHKISHYEVNNNKILIHIVTSLKNNGEVLLSLKKLDIRLQQIIPIAEEIKDVISSSPSPVPKGKAEIEWPLIGCREIHWDKGEAELEPGETEYMHADFILDASIKVIEAYSYIKNTYKQNREIGWSCTTIYEIKKEKL